MLRRFLKPRAFSRLPTGRALIPSSRIPTSKDVAKKLMQIVSSEKDIADYLQIYGTPGVTRTSVIKIGGEVIEKEIDTLVDSVMFLKEVGLFPIIVHGAGPQMNAELEKAGINPQYVGGMRVTDKNTLTIAKKIFLNANRKLVDALVSAGAPARPITSGVFEATVKDLDVYGYVGEISKINDEFVESAIINGQIPVLSCLGESKEGQTLNINADVAARQLAISVQPFKTIFINSKGGWIEDDGTKLKKIDMSKDYKRMASRDYTGRQGTLLKLNEINMLLQALPSTSSVALTSAAGLTREVLSSCSVGTICVKGDSSPSFTGSHEDRDGVKKYKVGLLGARGYVGREVIRLIGAHPNLELVCASSRALVGQRVLDIANAPPLNPHSNLPAIPNDRTPPLDVSEDLKFCDLGLEQIPTSPFGDEVDVWILALPNGYCDKYATALDGLRKENKIIIDLSADQRFNDKWVYGLPEASSNRMKLKGSSHIANPGCYATGAQLGILPLLGEHFDSSIPPHVFGVSGYSGAGTAPSNANNPAVLHDNILAYKSVNHIHEREISHQLGTPVRFMPHVAPFFQGIHLTISVQLKDHKLNENSILQIYNEFYANEYLVNVTPSIPLVKDNARKHQSTVGGFQFDNKSGRLAVIVTIDNLFKGAATQAVQNINISLGIDEYTALTDTN